MPDWEEWATDGQPYGTLRWFGDSWGAPVNDPVNHVGVPELSCAGCHSELVATDQGVTLPFWDGQAEARTIAYHLTCWLDAILGPT